MISQITVWNYERVVCKSCGSDRLERVDLRDGWSQTNNSWKNSYRCLNCRRVAPGADEAHWAWRIDRAAMRRDIRKLEKALANGGAGKGKQP